MYTIQYDNAESMLPPTNGRWPRTMHNFKPICTRCPGFRAF